MSDRAAASSKPRKAGSGEILAFPWRHDAPPPEALRSFLHSLAARLVQDRNPPSADWVPDGVTLGALLANPLPGDRATRRRFEKRLVLALVEDLHLAERIEEAVERQRARSWKMRR